MDAFRIVPVQMPGDATNPSEAVEELSGLRSRVSQFFVGAENAPGVMSDPRVVGPHDEEGAGVEGLSEVEVRLLLGILKERNALASSSDESSSESDEELVFETSDPKQVAASGRPAIIVPTPRVLERLGRRRAADTEKLEAVTRELWEADEEPK